MGPLWHGWKVQYSLYTCLVWQLHRYLFFFVSGDSTDEGGWITADQTPGDTMSAIMNPSVPLCTQPPTSLNPAGVNVSPLVRQQQTITTTSPPPPFLLQVGSVFICKNFLLNSCFNLHVPICWPMLRLWACLVFSFTPCHVRSIIEVNFLTIEFDFKLRCVSLRLT